MIPDIDNFRSARVLMKRHGENAPIHAAMRSDAMLDKGDLDGYAAWKRILRAVGGVAKGGARVQQQSSLNEICSALKS